MVVATTNVEDDVLALDVVTTVVVPVVAADKLMSICTVNRNRATFAVGSPGDQTMMVSPREAVRNVAREYLERKINSLQLSVKYLYACVIATVLKNKYTNAYLVQSNYLLINNSLFLNRKTRFLRQTIKTTSFYSHSPLSVPGGSMHDRALNGVYDLGGSCGVGRTNRSSVTLDCTRYCILQYASWLEPRLAFT